MNSLNLSWNDNLSVAASPTTRSSEKCIRAHSALASPKVNGTSPRNLR
ncbi:MAG: hypothetical protein ACLU9X_10880 [Alistipes shahii]